MKTLEKSRPEPEEDDLKARSLKKVKPGEKSFKDMLTGAKGPWTSVTKDVMVESYDIDSDLMRRLLRESRWSSLP